jgi:hypothetical protein
LPPAHTSCWPEPGHVRCLEGERACPTGRCSRRRASVCLRQARSSRRPLPAATDRQRWQPIHSRHGQGVIMRASGEVLQGTRVRRGSHGHRVASRRPSLRPAGTSSRFDVTVLRRGPTGSEAKEDSRSSVHELPESYASALLDFPGPQVSRCARRERGEFVQRPFLAVSALADQRPGGREDRGGSPGCRVAPWRPMRSARTAVAWWLRGRAQAPGPGRCPLALPWSEQSGVVYSPPRLYREMGSQSPTPA